MVQAKLPCQKFRIGTNPTVFLDFMDEEEHCGLTVSVRLIRSFEYRNIKSVVVRDVHPGQTVGEFQRRVEKGVFSH